MNKKAKARVAVLLVASVAGGAYAWTRYVRAQEVEPPLTFAGNVDVRDVTLSFRVAGRVEEVLKHEGDWVEEGDVIARLDATSYEAAVSQARAAVEVAKAQLASAEAGFRREDIAEAYAMLSEKKAASEHAEDTFRRAEKLRESGAVAQQTVDDARATRDRGKASLRAAQAAAARVASGTRPEDLAVARAQVAQAEAAVKVAEVSLADAVLRAPSRGVVLTRVVEPGAVVGAGSPALVVALTDPVWIRAFTPEKELAKLAPGTQVLVYTDGRPNEPYRGQVGYVAAQAEFTPKNVETAELRTSLVYRFRVVVSEHDDGLRQGMPVVVRIGSTNP
jgi:HlyD family secretion protein